MNAQNDPEMASIGFEIDALRHKTVAQLQIRFLDIPVVLSSGYDESEAAGRFAGKDFAGFIHKPYDANRLIEAVGSALRLETEE